MTHDERSLTDLSETFAYNDGNRDGRISLEEFKSLLDALDAGVGDEAARIGFAAIDTNRDGTIELDEFVDWWNDR